MGTIVVQAFMTLDGVIQSPGSADEDREGGFELGGWQAGYDLEELLLEWESKTEALLLGRKTYDIWSQAWGVWDENAPGLMGEFTRRYNRVPKYVASRTLTQLGWKNSRLLGEDLAAEVGAIRSAHEGEIRVWGSSNLIRSLAEFDLIDEYRLVVYPITLGTGKKLFSDDFPRSTFRLVDTQREASGVVVSKYRRASTLLPSA